MNPNGFADNTLKIHVEQWEDHMAPAYAQMKRKFKHFTLNLQHLEHKLAGDSIHQCFSIFKKLFGKTEVLCFYSS